MKKLFTTMVMMLGVTTLFAQEQVGTTTTTLSDGTVISRTDFSDGTHTTTETQGTPPESGDVIHSETDSKGGTFDQTGDGHTESTAGDDKED